jgi:hypothetical protein
MPNPFETLKRLGLTVAAVGVITVATAGCDVATPSPSSSEPPATRVLEVPTVPAQISCESPAPGRKEWRCVTPGAQPAPTPTKAPAVVNLENPTVPGANIYQAVLRLRGICPLAEVIFNVNENGAWVEKTVDVDPVTMAGLPSGKYGRWKVRCKK